MAAIAGLAPVANAAAAALLGPEAPTVLLAAVGHADWVAAHSDYHRRLDLSSKQPNSVTAAEVADALQRLLEVYAQQNLPGALANAVAGILAPQFAALTDRLDTMAAMIANQPRRDNNRTAYLLPFPVPLSVLVKERPLVGPPLPGRAASLPLQAVVGATCPFFPATVAAMAAITGPQLSRLAEWFNDHFDIVAGDALPARREEFRAFVMGL